MSNAREEVVADLYLVAGRIGRERRVLAVDRTRAVTQLGRKTSRVVFPVALEAGDMQVAADHPLHVLKASPEQSGASSLALEIGVWAMYSLHDK